MAELDRPYCTIDDVKVAYLNVSDPVKQEAVDSAAREIDARLGRVYAIPLKPNPYVLTEFGSPINAIPDTEKLLLQEINWKLATGRLRMELDTSGDGDQGNPYAMSLINEAMQLLCYI